MTNFIAFAILYVLGFGICNGLSYMVPVHHNWLWFPNNAGLVSGIIIGGFGLGALVFAPVATEVVNPNHEQAVDGHFSGDVDERVPLMLLILNLCFVGIAILSIAFVFQGPDPTQLNEEVVDKINTVFEAKALSGYSVSVAGNPAKQLG